MKMGNSHLDTAYCPKSKNNSDINLPTTDYDGFLKKEPKQMGQVTL